MSSDLISRSEVIETIYFGGGTPSILHNDDLSSILDEIQNNYSVAQDAEITIEANPDDIQLSSVKGWMNIGINRISLGIQTFSDEELRFMNRTHSSQQSLNSIRKIQDAGISNFSVDLIFGSQLQSDQDLIKNIEIVSSNNIPHVSCYALTAEPKTALQHFIKTKKVEEIHSEKQANQFLLTMDLLSQFGYEQYEISNYALPGMRSKHNSSYWRGKPYFGFGPSAHSYNGVNKRRWNIANNALYIQSIFAGNIPYEEESLTPTQQLNEYIMTAVRTVEGIDLQQIESKFGVEKTIQLVHSCETEIKAGRMVKTESNIYLSKTGKLFADGIAADLFFE